MWNCDGGRHDDGEEVSIDNHEFYLQIPPKFDQLPAKSSNGFDDDDDDDVDDDDDDDDDDGDGDGDDVFFVCLLFLRS